MRKIKQLIIIGNGGHSKVVQSLVKELEEYRVIEIWDDIYQKDGIIDDILCKPIPIGELKSNKAIKYFIAIGENKIRESIVKKLKLLPTDYATLIHPKAIVDKSSIVKPGSLIMANAVVQTNCSIGAHCIINTSSVVEHDSVIENFVHVGPNATVTGNCHLEDLVLLGAGSVLIPGTKVGHRSILGAGSVATRSISSNKVAYGNPAKIAM